MRRIYRATPPLVDRSVARLASGTREAMLAHLRSLGETEEAGGIARVYVRRRPEGARPSVEEFYVAAPAIVNEKEKKSFPQLWAAHTSGVSQLVLVAAPAADGAAAKQATKPWRTAARRTGAGQIDGARQIGLSL